MVESLEGGPGPDDESSEVTSGGQLEEVQSVDVAGLNSGDVSGSLGDESVFVGEDNKGALSGLVSSVSIFSLSGPDFPGFSNLL